MFCPQRIYVFCVYLRTINDYFSLLLQLNRVFITDAESAYCAARSDSSNQMDTISSLKADSHRACRTHAVPLPCRAAKGLECVFPIWFTQCGRVWFTLALPCHVLTMPFFSMPRHSTAVSRRPCCAVALRRTVWSEHGTGAAWAWHASVNQTRPHCVNQMGKTHSKRLAARHGRGTAWARHAMCESALKGLWPKSAILLDLPLCDLVAIYRHFEGTYPFNVRNRKVQISSYIKKHSSETSVSVYKNSRRHVPEYGNIPP